jgi:hypothetical protein
MMRMPAAEIAKGQPSGIGYRRSRGADRLNRLAVANATRYAMA